jgi:hypothetical protein
MFQLENEARKTLAHILGGVLILVGLYFTSHTIQVNQEGQITDRFTRAVNQLGSDRLEIRLGGIYALERIAFDSKRDYWPTMEILAAFLRERSPVKSVRPGSTPHSAGRLRSDIQAAVTVIGRRSLERHAEVGIPIFLDYVDLERTVLVKANLTGLNLRGANLRRANLIEANLVNAFLVESNLREVMLDRADLEGAELDGADLSGAILTGANLKSASLKGANLTMVRGLTATQVREATIDGETQLPQELRSVLSNRQ